MLPDVVLETKSSGRLVRKIPVNSREVFLSLTTSLHEFQDGLQRHTMLLPRLQPPLRAALASIARSSPSGTSTACLNEAFAALALKPLVFVRHASHAQQGAVNKAKDGPGKRLGAKKSGGLSTAHICRNIPSSEQALMISTNRAIRDPRQHHLPPTWHRLVPWGELQIRPRPLRLRHRVWLRALLPRSAETPEASIHRRSAAERGYTPIPPKCSAETEIEYESRKDK